MNDSACLELVFKLPAGLVPFVNVETVGVARLVSSDQIILSAM